MNILKTHQSANYNERKDQIKYIVLHYTELKTDEEAINILCDPKRAVSAHFLVSANGCNIYNLVAEEKRAWHAGASFWQGQTDLNSLSIGIEISYFPDIVNNHFPCFNKNQIATTIKLCKYLQNKYNILPYNILAHSDIAPLRKIDPGQSFPWGDLAKHDLGIYPNNINTKTELSGDDSLEKYLAIIGYSTKDIKKSIIAFQRRYFVKDMQSNCVSKKSIAFAKHLAELTLKGSN